MLICLHYQLRDSINGFNFEHLFTADHLKPNLFCQGDFLCLLDINLVSIFPQNSNMTNNKNHPPLLPGICYPELSGCITTLIVEVANFGAAMATLIDQDGYMCVYPGIVSCVIGRKVCHY